MKMSRIIASVKTSVESEVRIIISIKTLLAADIWREKLLFWE
jgi:hypothetical protein